MNQDSDKKFDEFMSRHRPSLPVAPVEEAKNIWNEISRSPMKRHSFRSSQFIPVAGICVIIAVIFIGKIQKMNKEDAMINSAIQQSFELNLEDPDSESLMDF